MITRLEVNGFKNVLGLEVDFGPYTCIAGPNAAGKSNIFDAIEFFALLADYPFMEAAQRLRPTGQRVADPRSLFWQNDRSPAATHLRLAAEMIVPAEVEDDFGRIVKPTTSFLRYEIELAYVASSNESIAQLGRIELISEELRHINLGDAAAHLRWNHSKKKFRDNLVFGRRSGTAYISTKVAEDGNRIVNVHQDGGSRGQPRTSPANRAPRSVVSTTSTSDDPTILAARREMQQWRSLALEPSAMRSSDALTDSADIAVNGAHLASALNRLLVDEPDAAAMVAAAAGALTDVREVRVDLDRHRELLTLEARLGTGPLLPARALSDGTLRFLALCIISIDSRFSGVLCMEEPENGIHPARMSPMVDLVRGLAVDPSYAPGGDNPIRQVIVNTHSPYFVQYQSAQDLLMAMPTRILRDGAAVSTVRLLPLAGSWRASYGPSVSRAEIMDYLVNPEDAQLVMDFA